MHPRAVIRRAVRSLLAGETVAGSRVEATRIAPYRRQELPAIGVYTLEETVDGESALTAPRELTRELKLEIAGWVTPGSSVDDAMDALALQIEQAMEADPTLGGVAGDSILVSTTTGLQGEGEQLMGLVTLEYSVTYRTDVLELAEGSGEFLTADVLFNLRPPEPPEDDSAHDELTVRSEA